MALGIITATATNPIWVVKTRLQLQHITPPLPSPSLSSIGSLRPPQSHSKSKPPLTPLFAHSFRSLSSFPLHPQSSRVTTSYGTALKIFKTEGIRGFYRGLSASLLGVTEGTIQWGLYEEFKRLARTGLREGEDGGWRVSAAAGGAKLVATGITYPHEVRFFPLRLSCPCALPRVAW
jgi:solute carrier family 25 protein 33/36